jgi:hypothetical protein
MDGNVTPISLARPPAGGESAVKHRSAERFTLMLRVAKLVSSHGEYACVIRDVSATGVRLRLFHRLPAEKRLALMLANGECYFIENVWENEREAGFQFSARIDVAAFIQESSRHPKRQVRLALELPANLATREISTPIVIRDLSQHGARIESARALMVDQHLRLKAEHLPEIFATVRWKRGPDHGLVFQNGFRLDELAQIAWKVAEPAEIATQHAAQLMAAKFAEAPALPTASNLRAG